MKEYLSLPNVISIGGSWLTPQNLLKTSNWKAILELAQEASKIASSV